MTFKFFLQDFAFFLSPTPRYVYKFTSTVESVFRVIHKSSSSSFLIFRLIVQEAYIQNYELNDWRVHASHCIHDYNYKALKVIFQTLVFPVKLYFSRNFEESKMNIVRLAPMRI